VPHGCPRGGHLRQGRRSLGSLGAAPVRGSYGAAPLQPDVAGPIASVAAIEGDEALYTRYISRMQEAQKTDAQEEARFRGALTSFYDPALIGRYADDIFSDLIRDQDRSVLIRGMGYLMNAREAALRASAANWDAYVTKMDPSGKQRIVTGFGQLTPHALVKRATTRLSEKRRPDNRETDPDAVEKLRIGSANSERMAGELGANLLTHLLGQSLDELAAKLTLYREALRTHHPDRLPGHVTLMLHTFLGRDLDTVRATVREPFISYLKASFGLIRNLARSLSRDVDPSKLAPDDLDSLMALAFDRYFETSGLLGTPETCLQMIQRLQGMGACIGVGLDFLKPRLGGLLGGLTPIILHLDVIGDLADGWIGVR